MSWVGETPVELIDAVEHSVGLAAQLTARLGETIHCWYAIEVVGVPGCLKGEFCYLVAKFR